MHEEIEDIDHSTLSANEFCTKSDEVVPKPKKHDPIDFQIVTRIPEKNYRFQWIIRQYSTLSPNIALYSTDIHILDTTRYRLKLVKYENGFGLFHVSKEKSDETRKEDEINAVNRENESRVSYAIGWASPIEIARSAPSTASAKEAVPNAKTNVSDDFTFKTAYQISTSDSMSKDLMKWSMIR
ncbi:hypothetical protein HNY73_018847 [Argiope bruennichi]|uniref:Uncharacterized protein n=1 Tax=Argiope bruennichi TaxID=94029 RepID=A0A8T0EEA5_ARGBR|nr:hypothetical protein HNY73_018847 [Argiope bruennichi]